MLGLLKKLFGAKEAAPAPAEVPYKVEVAQDPLTGIVYTPKVEAQIEKPAEAAPVETAPAAKPAKKPAAKKPAAPKKAPAPKAAPTKSTGTRKPKAKPAA